MLRSVTFYPGLAAGELRLSRFGQSLRAQASEVCNERGVCHEQGHGPVKVLGIEAGTNITVGLPVMRTSVDHGTSFDIAGSGKADFQSMVEAIHQAAQMATRAN